ncbi:MAG TPA: rhomboid family intramembrane serine protease [Candidatus Binatia bacterium]|nr:rhomboid family intramembrane serine protease [Candidatus Binatia bacterium]
MTYGIVAINVVIFLGELWLDAQGNLDAFIRTWGVVPVEFLRAPGAEWPTLFTSMFLHGGWAHVLGNMLYLWIFGDNLEDVLGPARFLIFYLIGGLVATGAQIAIGPQSSVPTIGASGAIAGVLGGYLLLFPRARITTLVFRFITQVPAIIVLGFWFVYQFFFGIASLSNMDMQVGGVAFFAHIGGFVAGLILIRPFQLGRGSSGEYDRYSDDPWR